MEIARRMEVAIAMREAFPRFRDFARVAMDFLGFPLTAMQADICDYMQDGVRLRMVMAQRGEAKSTLAALYGVWRIIQQPSTKVLIVSGGETQASEVASLVVRLILVWDILEYLRPDARTGDRTSAASFDVHWSLKGLDKSPSVACIGITAQLQGKRADLLISDDIETSKNGMTVTQREQLRQLSKEFSSICTHGDILYLGTPQTKDSIYNGLRARGFEVRIWPGRFPTVEEQERYGDHLAPFLSERIKADPSLQKGGGIDGTRGKPADPHRYDESALQEKELDQGPEGFQLQFMLDTSLADAARQQLKLSDFIVANFDAEQLPESLVWTTQPQFAVKLPDGFSVPQAKMWHPLMPANVSYGAGGRVVMTVDPAGGGGDEFAFAVGKAFGPYVHVLSVGGLRGGLIDENGYAIARLCQELKVEYIHCESNMGAGLVEKHLKALLVKWADDTERADYDPAQAREYLRIKSLGIGGEWSTGQKERRIINNIVGALQRHKIVLHPRVFEDDVKYCAQHSLDKRTQFSLFYQIDNITTDRDSLQKDDRIEALSMLIKQFHSALVLDEKQAAQQREQQAYQEFLNNPMGRKHVQPSTTQGTGTRSTIHRRRR